MTLEPGDRLGLYEIISIVGSGGMGEVYRARDEYLARDVAIKVLSQKREPNDSAVARFFREARAASALNHPHIVTIHTAGKSEAGHYIVMELVHGRTLRALIGKPVTADVLRDLGAQIGKALAAAHKAGIAHRDIKPENIMVRDDGYVKVLDFGLARLEPPVSAPDTQPPGTVTQRIVCTPRYVSPERAHGEAGDSASDIFSLGIVFYELATGQHPFVAGSAFDTALAIMSEQPVPPSRLNPELPADLDALILQMLEKKPANRPGAEDVVKVLSVPLITGRSIGTARKADVHSIVGRASEQTLLGAAFAEAASGHSLVMCVTGEPGIGKSTLVESFVVEQERTGPAAHIARGRCSERLAGNEAYLPILDALESLLRRGNAEGTSLSRILKGVAPLWHAQLSSGSTEALTLSGPAAAGSQERLKRELVAFLEEATRTVPLLLFIDDIHWADVSTVDLLGYVASRFASMRILIIVTYRPDELLRERHPFRRLKQDLQTRGCCRELALDFLTAGDVESYLEAEFPSHRFPSSFTKLLHEKTEGNPLFMVDMVRYLRDQAILSRDNGTWTVNQAMPDLARTLPESVRSMIQRKIDLLEEAERRLLAMASVQGYEFDAAVVAQVLAMEPADVEEQLERLERIDAFVQSAGEREYPGHTVTTRYRFVHVLYQNMLYATLTSARKVALARKVVHSLETLHGSQITDIAVEVAVLCQVGREFARAADYFLMASQYAARIFAYQEAVLLAERGLESLEPLPHDEDRKRKELALLLALSLPVVAVKGYSHPDVERIYGRAKTLCLELNLTSPLIRALRGLFTFHLVALRLDIAHELARELVALTAQGDDPGLQIFGYNAVGWVDYYRGDFVAAMEQFDRGLARYNRDAHGRYFALFGSDVETTMRGLRACILWTLGAPDRAASEIERSVDFARGLHHAYTLAYILFYAVLVYQFRRDWDRARSYSKELLALTTQTSMTHFKAAAQNFLARDLVERGNRSEAIEQMRASLIAYEAAGAQTSRPRFRAELADQLGKAGRVDEGLQVVADEIAVIGSAQFHLAELCRVRGELLLAKGGAAALEQAESSLLNALSIARAQNAKSFELRAAMSLHRYWLHRDLPARARLVLAEAYSWFTEGFETGDLREAKAMLDVLPVE